MKRRKSATDPGQLRLGFGPLSPPPNEPPPEPVVSQGLVEQLAEWCSRHQKDPKILFVPSRQIGRNLLTALAASGRSCANLTVTTPLEHALATATPALEAAGWRRLRFDADLLILSEIVIDSSSGYRRRPGPLSISLSRPHSGADKDPAQVLPLIPDRADDGLDEAESLLSARNAGDYGARILGAWPALACGEIAARSRRQSGTSSPSASTGAYAAPSTFSLTTSHRPWRPRQTTPRCPPISPLSFGKGTPAGNLMPEPAPPPLSDAPDRAKMASALDENVVLLAGAGAGKTYAPVEQMVATIREGVEAVDHLAAITSTRRSSISSMKRHRPSPIPAGAGRRSPFSSF